MSTEQVITCASACTVTVVHEFSFLPYLTLENGFLIAKAILLAWCIGWVIRQLMRL